MPDNDNNEAFNGLTQARAVTEVPAPSTDNHATIDGSNSVWNDLTNAPFITNLSGGQEQRLVLSADHIVQVQHNQIVKIQQAQNTTARLEITITSAENQIYLVERQPWRPCWSGPWRRRASARRQSPLGPRLHSAEGAEKRRYCLYVTAQRALA